MVKQTKDDDPWLAIKLHPINSRHITDYNRELVDQNKKLIAKNEDLKEQVKTMRRNYNRELNNKFNQEAQAKKRLEKLERSGFLHMKEDLIDFHSIKFFDVTDGIDEEIVEMLNLKIQILKDKFSEWQVNQLEYTKTL